MVRATLESTTNGILATDAEGKITGFNKNFLNIWRIPEGVLEARDHRKMLEVTSKFVKEPGQFLGRIEEIYALSPPETFDFIELADGRTVARFTRTQFVDDRDVGRVWSFRDITERKRTEAELRQQREWFQVTLSSIGDAVITVDNERNVTFLNPVAEMMTGWKSTDALGKRLETIFKIINEDTRERTADPVDAVLRDGAVVGLATHTALLARDGTETGIEDSAAPIRDADGKVSGAVMVFHDVTEPRRGARALRQSEDRFRAIFDHAAGG